MTTIDRDHLTMRGKKDQPQSTATGAAVRQSLRPLHLLQSTSPVDRLHIDIGDRDGKCSGEPERRARRSPGGDDGLRRGGRVTTARLVELDLTVDHDRFVHEVRGCAELIHYDTRDTLVVEQQQSPDR